MANVVSRCFNHPTTPHLRSLFINFTGPDATGKSANILAIPASDCRNMLGNWWENHGQNDVFVGSIVFPTRISRQEVLQILFCSQTGWNRRGFQQFPEFPTTGLLSDSWQMRCSMLAQRFPSDPTGCRCKINLAQAIYMIYMVRAQESARG